MPDSPLFEGRLLDVLLPEGRPLGAETPLLEMRPSEPETPLPEGRLLELELEPPLAEGRPLELEPSLVEGRPLRLEPPLLVEARFALLRVEDGSWETARVRSWVSGHSGCGLHCSSPFNEDIVIG